ncbi:MAG: UDP-glucose/GDP-mannose dehydrogenase family protein [Gorillibacterium sp.]|nr:UDP-glucose/GDP-mannose dehydrogenase family protein [Gorillibacterium sp.]
MNIAVIGTGYVGLVTGVCLSEIGHQVTCIDINEEKVAKMKQGISPIYEPGLEKLMIRNRDAGRLNFTTSHREGFLWADLIIIAVGTPQREDGSANLAYIEQAAKDIGRHIRNDSIIVVKSTVPVGTNEYVKAVIEGHLKQIVKIRIASNPEFLREGSAVHDTFHGDRIVIGAEDEETGKVLEQVYLPFGVPIYQTDLRSAEMIKYASNAFLATKISFMNEISNVCEKLGANVEHVALGMGMDKRIGGQFLKAGIGYGGSCFPKDTKALVQMSGDVEYVFKLLHSVIEVNRDQQTKLVRSAMARFGHVKGMRIALLGLAFKPNTDDMREAPSIAIAEQLVALGADVIGYDPVAMKGAKHVLPEEMSYAASIKEALLDADAAFILTEWPEIASLDLDLARAWMKEPIIFDGRNCFTLDAAIAAGFEYHSIGRKSIVKESLLTDNFSEYILEAKN